MIPVVIVDDHPVVRAGLRTILKKAGHIQILAEGASGADALRLVAEHHPHVLILDVNLPDMDGLEVVRQLRREGTETAILVLTVHKDKQTIFGLLECGATGYVLKDEALETLVQAVQAAAKGEVWLSPSIAAQVVRRAVNPPADAEPPSESGLTPSEMRVFLLLAEGMDNAAIARTLAITKRTVQNHISAIYAKLGVNSRTEAMLFALRRGLVHLDSS
jgi:two-component system, NarL family, response regulator YdfI